MFRHQLHAQVRIGQYRDYYNLYEKLDQDNACQEARPSPAMGREPGATE